MNRPYIAFPGWEGIFPLPGQAIRQTADVFLDLETVILYRKKGNFYLHLYSFMLICIW